jgi:hypothetical protein
VRDPNGGISLDFGKVYNKQGNKFLHSVAYVDSKGDPQRINVLLDGVAGQWNDEPDPRTGKRPSETEIDKELSGKGSFINVTPSVRQGAPDKVRTAINKSLGDEGLMKDGAAFESNMSGIINLAPYAGYEGMARNAAMDAYTIYLMQWFLGNKTSNR